MPDWLAGVEGAVSGATGASQPPDERSRLRLNKPVPKSYGGSGEESTGSYKHGGKVKRTGPAKLHKGERVLTKKQAKKYAKKSGRK